MKRSALVLPALPSRAMPSRAKPRRTGPRPARLRHTMPIAAEAANASFAGARRDVSRRLALPSAVIMMRPNEHRTHPPTRRPPLMRVVFSSRQDHGRRSRRLCRSRVGVLCGDCFDRKTNLPAELGYVLDIGLDGIRSTAVIRSIDRASRDVACYKDRTMISLEQASSRLAHEAAP